MGLSVQRLIDWAVRGLLLLFALIVIAVFIGVWSDKSRIQERAGRTKALAHAKQIHLALSEYAIDFDGKFPSSSTNSNVAFRQLFDQKFQTERIFFVRGSAWHNALPEGQTKPDNDVGSPPDYAQGLSSGENHWAYQSELTNDSPGNLPLVMDGFSDRLGVYSDDLEKRGGVWEGDVALVVRIDGSAKMEKLKGDFRVYEEVDGKQVDIFSREYGTDPAKLLNPW